ncbi:protein FRG1 homolog [Teleopsis dalmanni]|uniref:protein FRG1 homolog n=1 Tax=Teleopsis dalmanni TaxID=139649 RepID=UPI0018CCF6C1|nr:protein FRG1 homolog [Teleopsis dalmanni]
MSEYDKCLIGKLVLKGDERRKKKKRKLHKENPNDSKILKPEIDYDASKHGGWAISKDFSDLIGAVAIEFRENSYIKALENGLISLGLPHLHGEGPHPEEIFSVLPVNGDKISFKSGYGKYLGIEKDGKITGRSDAVGIMEQWQPLFEDGKMSFLSEIGSFMSINPETGACTASKRSVAENEKFKLRCKSLKNPVKNCEFKGDLNKLEKDCVKKFQKFQNKKLRICEDGNEQLERAEENGSFHETLLDRRAKMKSDRYCK